VLLKKKNEFEIKEISRKINEDRRKEINMI